MYSRWLPSMPSLRNSFHFPPAPRNQSFSSINQQPIYPVPNNNIIQYMIDQSEAQPEQSKPHLVRNRRQMRPSAFLNHLDLLPQLIALPQATTVKHKSKKSELGSLPTQPDSQELIRLPPIDPQPKVRHKHIISMPEIVHPKLSFVLPHDNFLAQQFYVRSSVMNNERFQPETSRRRVEFRKSILVVDLDNGCISKGEIDGQVKPLKRLRRKQTMMRKDE